MFLASTYDLVFLSSASTGHNASFFAIFVFRALYFKIVFAKLFVAFPMVETSIGPGGFMICVLII